MALLSLLILATTRCRSGFDAGYKSYLNRDFEQAKPVFEKYQSHKKYGLAARFYLHEIQMRGKTDFPNLFSAEKNYQQLIGVCDSLPTKTAILLEKKYHFSKNQVAKSRLANQQLALRLTRGWADLLVLDSLLAGMPQIMPDIKPELDSLRTELANADLEKPDYRRLTSIKNRHLSYIRPENYAQSRQLPDRIWQQFLSEYGACRLDLYVRDHPNSFVARDCWHEPVRQALCDGRLRTLLAFHNQQRWTALEFQITGEIMESAKHMPASALSESQKQTLDGLKTLYSLRSNLRKGEGLEDTAAYNSALRACIRQFAPRYSAYRLLVESLQFYLENRDYSGAIDFLSFARPFFTDTLPKPCRSDFDFQVRVRPYIDGVLPILKAPPRPVHLNPLLPLNTTEGSEFSPAADTSLTQVYFAATGRRDNVEGADVFYSFKKDGQWQQPKLVAELSGAGDQIPMSLALNGQTLLVRNKGAVYVCSVKAGAVLAQKPVEHLGLAVQGRVFFASDGQSLLVEGSQIPGTVLQAPDIDIFYLPWEAAEGKWGKPVSLGSEINTEGEEASPLMSADGQYLYFTCQNGYPGLGKSDIFRSKRIGTRWNDWSRPDHLGKEINDTYQHYGFGGIRADGKAWIYAHFPQDGSVGDLWMGTEE